MSESLAMDLLGWAMCSGGIAGGAFGLAWAIWGRGGKR